ncbi:Lacal_2735 family protein [Flavobacteriaceae bacterium]|nr:Lacal_2735 family protein [Flavobacteriaceae bacterium]
MFGLFKRKTETEKLQNRYKKLMAEWHDLSSIDRSASDAKYAEAQKVLDQLDELTN